jgi:hypothetical protein
MQLYLPVSGNNFTSQQPSVSTQDAFAQKHADIFFHLRGRYDHAM